MSDLILYTSPDGSTRLDLRVEGQTVWLTQLEIAELFQTTKQNVNLHAKNIFQDGELAENSVVKESLTVQTQEARQADAADLREIEELEKQIKQLPPKPEAGE